MLPTASKQKVLATVLLGNFGLLIIDHIHFQYNGILFGILLLSMGYMCEAKFLKSAFYFAVLLNMKHIFIYVSPVYIMYLLKVYCWQRASVATTILNLMKLAIITLGVTALSFGPFIHQLPQVWPLYLFFDVFYILIAKPSFFSTKYRSFLVCFHSVEVFVMPIGLQISGQSIILPIEQLWL